MAGLSLLPDLRPVVALGPNVGRRIGVSSWVFQFARILTNTGMQLTNPIGSRVFQPSSVLLSSFPEGNSTCFSGIIFGFLSHDLNGKTG